MITRSRTGLYLSYRDSYVSEDTNTSLEQPLLNDYNELNSLPPRWVDISDEIGGLLSLNTNLISDLDALHSKRLLPRFNDRSEEEKEIDNLTIEITNNFKSAHHLLSKIESHTDTVDQISISNNIKSALASKIQSLSSTFRKKQRIYLDKLSGHNQSNFDIAPPDTYQSVKDDEQLSRQQLNSHQLQLQSDNELDQRDLEINNIAQSITDLADLFRDLNTLVIDQGTMLDRIDYNAQGTKTQVDNAVTQLNQATKYQRSSSKFKCICLLILLILLVIVFIIYKPHMH